MNLVPPISKDPVNRGLPGRGMMAFEWDRGEPGSMAVLSANSGSSIDKHRQLVDIHLDKFIRAILQAPEFINVYG